MPSPLKLSGRARELLRCPACAAPLQVLASSCQCTGPNCGRCYPVIDGIPVLLNEDNSVFAIEDFAQQRNTFFNLRPSRAARFLDRITPSISTNVKAAGNYAHFVQLLLATAPRPVILILGGSVAGKGMAPLLANSRLELIESDVSFGPRTGLICDGHDIPIADGAIDGVVVQAVLEHVVDPHRVAAEIHRVLQRDGLVYAETPFMQQMHGGRYDFERFSYWGHRRLFRQFSEVDSGIACGPGMALAWSWTYFLRSFACSNRMRHALNLFGSLTSFWLKWFDKYLVNRPQALAAASGFYFLGRKCPTVLSDRDLIGTYKSTH